MKIFSDKIFVKQFSISSNYSFEEIIEKFKAQPPLSSIMARSLKRYHPYEIKINRDAKNKAKIYIKITVLYLSAGISAVLKKDNDKSIFIAKYFISKTIFMICFIFPIVSLFVIVIMLLLTFELFWVLGAIPCPIILLVFYMQTVEFPLSAIKHELEILLT